MTRALQKKNYKLIYQFQLKIHSFQLFALKRAKINVRRRNEKKKKTVKSYMAFQPIIIVG